MKVYLALITLMLWISFGFWKTPPDDQPMTCKRVLELPDRDSVFLNPVYFCIDSLDNYLYYSSIKTTVCSDTLCQLVFLDIYWDLAGNYVRFDTLQGIPLTKNDHLPFSSQDYFKLQTTLRNENSILGEKTRDELLDQIQTRYSKEIDAVTGATAKELKSAVVEGALYSTYTLWHLVNDGIKQKILENTLKINNAEIEKQLLNSQNPRTIIIGLRNLDEKYYFNHFEEILELMKSGHPLVNFYIVKKMPQNLLKIEQNRKSILEMWDQFDRNTQSVIGSYLNP